MPAPFTAYLRHCPASVPFTSSMSAETIHHSTRVCKVGYRREIQQRKRRVSTFVRSLKQCRKVLASIY